LVNTPEKIEAKSGEARSAILFGFPPFCLDFRQFVWISAILFGFPPICLDFRHFAWMVSGNLL